MAADTHHLKVGVTLPLTGPLAHVGQDIKRGIELAINDLTFAPIRFELVFEDNEHDPRRAATTAHKLLEQDHVEVIISLWDMADVVAPLAERRKVPHLTIRWDPQIAKRYQFTMTLESSYQSYVEAQAQLLKLLRVRTLAILSEESQGWILGSDYLAKIAPNKGFTVIGNERVTRSDRDFRSSILRLLAKKPDIIVLFSNPPVTEILIRQLRELHPNQPFTGYFEVLTDPSLVEGIPFVAQYQVAPWFAEEFHDRYGEQFVSRAPQAYDLFHLLALAEVASDSKLTGEGLIQALTSQGELSGASGTLQMNQTRNIENECVFKIARGRTFDLLRIADILKQSTRHGETARLIPGHTAPPG